MSPTPRPPGRLLRILVGVWLIVVCIDAFPFWNAARETLDPVLDKTGLWQGPWNLFAPEPDRVNVRVGATIHYADGGMTQWRSPDWQNLSGLDRFLRFRDMEWVDGIRTDDNSGAWDDFARYLGRTAVHPRGSLSPVVMVRLTRYWATIPPPEAGVLPAEPYLRFRGVQTFHVWEAEPRMPASEEARE